MNDAIETAAPASAHNAFSLLGTPGFHFEADTGAGASGAGGVAAPADPAAGAADPGTALPPIDGLQPQGQPQGGLEGMTAEELRAFMETGREMTAIFREATQLAQQPPQAAQPQQPVQPAQPPQPSRLEQALQNFDAFRPDSLGEVLQAQAHDLMEQFGQQLQGALGPIANIVQEIGMERGEQAASAELDSFVPHLAQQFPGLTAEQLEPLKEGIIERAGYLLAVNEQLDERDALWQAAHREVARDRESARRGAEAYRAYLARVGSVPTDPAAGAPAGGEVRQLPTGPGKYAAVVKDRMRRDAARVPTSI